VPDSRRCTWHLRHANDTARNDINNIKGTTPHMVNLRSHATRLGVLDIGSNTIREAPNGNKVLRKIEERIG